MGTAEKILIVEDDAAVAEMVQTRLVREGFEVQWASDGAAGFEQVHTFQPQLILLDLTMPRMSGIEVCRRLREGEATRHIPIIMVTAHSADEEVTQGLDVGADDYVAKPFSVRQLISRIRAVLRRAPAPTPPPSDTLQVGEIVLDQRSHEVRARGELVPFTVTEFDILWHMAKDPGKVFSREMLLKLLDREEGELVKRNIDVHMTTVRKKLGAEGKRILTVRGKGYKVKA